ncbi:MAG: class II glutamine amidotransferase [Candidatus Thermoplasmatota archaeon]|nr:class II glutamine amidotransferase [Candidatus Thermoplasmatota archaeon]
MMLLKGNYEPVIDPMLLAFKEVCRNDPLNREPDGSIYQHADGWGSVNIHDTIEYTKSAEPVYLAKRIEPKGGIFMIHARKTSTGEPSGVGFTHPFHGSDSDNEYWLCHNGDFDKAKLAEYMGKPTPTGESDSQVFFDLFLIQPGNAKKKLSQAIKIVNDLHAIKSIANLFLISYNRISGERSGLAYTDAPADKPYGEHSMLYSVRNKEIRAFFSSSIAYSRHFEKIGFSAADSIPRGTIVEI